MTLTQLYAAVCLPLLLARGVYELLLAYSGLTDPLIYTACLGVFLVFLLLGYEVEGYYFREVSEGKDWLPRMLWFVLGLPALYVLSLGLGALSYAFLSNFWFLIPVPVFLLSLTLGLWYLLTDHHHRGRRVYSQRYMAQIGRATLPPGDPGFPIGGVPVPSRQSTHRCYVGTTGSGKTTEIKRDMTACLPLIGKGPESARAAIFDPKTELLDYVTKLATCPVHTLHPFDARGKAWAMCRDIRSPKAALQFAVTLIPREEGQNAYFSNAARALVRAVLMSFILNDKSHALNAWTFRDLILACETERTLRAVLGRNAITKRAITKYLDAREKNSVLSTLDTFTDEYAPIAACWAKAEPMSLREWSEGNSIVIFAQDEESPESLALINGLMIRFVTQMLLQHSTNDQLRREKKPERLTYLFLDEIREIAQRLPQPLTALLTRGRAYGITCINGWQSHSGMKDALNPNRAAEIIAMHGLVGMLRVQDDETAKYFSAVIDEREVIRKSTSTGGGGTSHNWQLTREPVLMPGVFSEMPAGTGYFLGPPPLGLWRAEMPLPKDLAQDQPTIPDFLPRPQYGELVQEKVEVSDPHQWLDPWTKEDLERLNLPLNLLEEEKQQGQQTRPSNQETEQSTPPPGGEQQRAGKDRLQVVDLRDRRRASGR